MKKLLFIILTALTVLCEAQLPPDDPTWQLVFNEDFNTLDAVNIWNIFTDVGAFGTNPSPTASPDNLCKNDANHLQIINGNLVLTAFKESSPVQCPSYGQSGKCDQQYYDYTCGVVSSRNQNFTYGYYEMRAKMDFQKGFWPTLWLLNSATKQHYSEIDIAEMVGLQPSLVHGPTNDNNIYTINAHGPDPGSPNDIDPSLQKYYHEISIPDYKQYHTYGLEWSPNQIKWYLDGYIVGRLAPPAGQFDQYMAIILDTKFRSSLAAGTSPPPAKMYVDYVRYYQLKGNCSPPISACSYNFSSHIDDTKQYYEVGGAGCSDIVPSGRNYVFRGKEHIDLKEGFEVPVGSEFYANADQYCDLPTYSTGVCGFPFTPCSYDFSGYINDVKQIIEISGSGCSATVNPTDNVLLHATEYIDLKEGFSVPLGSEIEIRTMVCPP